MTAADPREDARHRRADALARQADALAHVGDLARARDLYGQAGDLAAAVARACAPGIDSLGPFIAARAVTLWCNAGRFADARDLALAYLRGADLDPFARLCLQASLDRARIAAATTAPPPSARPPSPRALRTADCPLPRNTHTSKETR